MAEEPPVLMQVQDHDGDWHYHLEGGFGWMSVTDKVFVSNDSGVPCFYIEPCGQFPGGFYVPIRWLDRLLEDDTVFPHYYESDGDRDEIIKAEGVGFDILADSESPEADAIEDRLVRMGGFIG
jgi:hypothetical protein